MPTYIQNSPPNTVSRVTASSHEGIQVKSGIQSTFERIPFSELIHIPITNKPWKSCYVPTDQIERENSNWFQIRSALGIFVVRKCWNDSFYEVAVCVSYIPWLYKYSFEFKLDLDFDRTKPSDKEERVYGRLTAKRRTRSFLLSQIKEAIWSNRGKGIESFFRHTAPSEVKIPIEWAILSHDILEAGPQVRQKFAQLLQFISLNLVKDYNTPAVRKLLGMEERELLEFLPEDHTDLLAIPNSQQTAQYHIISLLRCLFVFSGGRDDIQQRKFDTKRTANSNANLYGSLVGISGSNCFGSFNSQAMLEALSESKVFANDDISVFGITQLTSQMIAFLPIGFPHEYWGLPTEVLCELSREQVDHIRVQIAHIHHEQPTLRRSENDILLFLTWTSMVSGQLPRVLIEWAISNGWLYERLIRDLEASRETEQAALTLMALLCYKRLLPHSPDDKTHIRRSYLADFDALMKGESLTNERTVFKHMIFSLLRAIDTFEDEYRGIYQLLVTVLDEDIPALEPRDRFLDQYWIYRIKSKSSHKDVFASLNHAESNSLPQWHRSWITVLVIVLSLSVFPSLKLSLVLTIFLLSTCAESCTLFIEYRLYRNAHQPNRWPILAYASLSFLKFLLAYVFVIWSQLTDIDSFAVLSPLLSISSICGLQTILQVYSSIKQNFCPIWCRVRDSKKSPGFKTGRGIKDLEKALRHDMGGQ